MKYKKWDYIVVPNQEVLKWKDALLQCVYMWVCKFANDDWVCFPSYQTIADCAWCSRRTVVRKIKELVKIWLLQKTNRYKEKKQKSNLYQIMLRGDTVTPPSDRESPPRGDTDAHRTTTNNWTPPPKVDFSEDYKTIKDKWNNINQYITDKKNKVANCTEDTPHLLNEFKKLRKDYTVEHFEKAFIKLAKTLRKKTKDSPGYWKKRSLYDFLKNWYGFINYVHKW